METERLHACDLSWWAAQCAFVGTSARGEIAESRELWLTSCGFPATAFNRAYLKEPEGDVPAALARAEAWFARRDLPFLVTLRDDGEATCASALRDAGYERKDDPAPVMTLDPIRADPIRADPIRAVDPALEIVQVRSTEDLARFGETAFEGFGIPKQAAPLFITEQFQRMPGVQLYLGLVDGAPVTTSALVPTYGIAGIYFVATLESHRRRGLGEAMTWAALRGGLETGCTWACLQASALGAPVYARMGFETPAHQLSYARA